MRATAVVTCRGRGARRYRASSGPSSNPTNEPTRTRSGEPSGRPESDPTSGRTTTAENRRIRTTPTAAVAPSVHILPGGGRGQARTTRRWSFSLWPRSSAVEASVDCEQWRLAQQCRTSMSNDATPQIKHATHDRPRQPPPSLLHGWGAELQRQWTVPSQAHAGAGAVFSRRS